MFSSTQLKRCFCVVCQGNGPLLSQFTRSKHKRLYGIVSERQTTQGDELDDDERKQHDADYPVDTYNPADADNTDSDSNSAIESSNPVDADNTDSDSNYSVESSIEDDDFSGFAGNPNTDFSDDNENVVFRPNKVISKGEWSCVFNKDLYLSGIAIQKLNNSDLTVLQWLAMNFHVFSSHPSMSKSAFSDNLKVQKIVQNDECLPSSYHEAKRMIKPYLVQKIIFDVCSNDCMVYRNSSKFAYADLTLCPLCTEDRFFKNASKQPVSKRTFHYIPIGPRLARIYGNANLAQIVQSHPGSRNDLLYKDNQMWDIHDSPIWKDLYSDGGYFKGNKFGLSFALEVDGVNPYHNIGVIYSMTPIMMTILNLPRHIRNAFGNIYLIGIIKGNNRSETSNLDPYIEILVDELIYLSGCTCYSEYHNAPVEVKFKLLLYVLDYPGMSKFFHLHGSGSLAGCHWCTCHWCTIRGIHCSHLQKVIYLGNRKYLGEDDPMRQDTFGFYEKYASSSVQPDAKKMDSELGYREAFEKAKNKTQAASVATATGCRGKYAILNLPDHDRLQESCPDACHTIKDVIQNILHFITGKKIDKQKVVAAEKSYGRSKLLERTECSDASMSESSTAIPRKRKWHSRCGLKQTTNSTSNEIDVQMSFFLSKDEISRADERAKSMQVPLGFGLRPSAFISKTGHLKSHDWKQLATQGILKFCLRGMLGNQQRQTLFMLLDCISDLCNENQCIDNLNDLEARLNVALAMLERDFPLILQNITTHILHHIVDGIRKFGPVYSTWMYVFERFNAWLCQRALNMRYPEASAIETYIIFDWCQFMISSGKVDLSKFGIPSVTTCDFADYDDCQSQDANSSTSSKKSLKL